VAILPAWGIAAALVATLEGAAVPVLQLGAATTVALVVQQGQVRGK